MAVLMLNLDVALPNAFLRDFLVSCMLCAKGKRALGLGCLLLNIMKNIHHLANVDNTMQC